MTENLHRIAVVMFQPRDVVNVAGVIRVMSNFGLTDLRIIEPAAFDPHRIEGIAHHTAHIAAAARSFGSLPEALSDCTLVLGTTGRPREARSLVLAPRTAAPRLLQEAAAGGRAAVLFGPEEDGLANEALARCHGIIRIPTHPHNRSLNLAQAALVIAYELWIAAAEADRMPAAEAAGARCAPRRPGLAGGAAREALFATVQEFLQALYPGTGGTRLAGAMSRLRTVFMRAAPDEAETAALTNLFRHAGRRLAAEDRTRPGQAPDGRGGPRTGR